ncbi:hypothetical protein B0H14DRAFT_2618590 [Mycena olivaceomarginata]|nr:hypothetical protein B0H14DRAFT_2618590 [Mycena olivaceomarginata]
MCDGPDVLVKRIDSQTAMAVSGRNRPTAKEQTHSLCRHKGGPVSRGEQGNEKGAESQPMQDAKEDQRTSEQREQGNRKGADSQTMQAQRRTSEQREQGDWARGRLTYYGGAKEDQLQRRTSEQREQYNEKGGRFTYYADAKEDQCKGGPVQRRTSEQREQGNGKGEDSHPRQVQRRTSEKREQGDGKGGRLTFYSGINEKPVQRRTSEQREQGNGKGADSQTMEVQRRTSTKEDHEQREQGNHCISAVSGPKGAPRCLGRPGHTLGSADPAEVCLALQAIVAQLFSRRAIQW